MNINTLIDTLSRAIARDAATSSWLTAIYGRAHQVYVNLDERNPPDADDCPYAALMPAAKRVGQDVNPRRHIVEAVCVVHDDSSRTHADLNLTEYLGVSRLEKFRKYTETAAFTALTGNLALSAVDVEYDTISMFPYLLAWTTLEITEPVLISSDPLE